MKIIKRYSPILGAIAAIAVLALLLVIYNITRPVPIVGTKNITIDVVYESGNKDHYELTTDEQFLLNALKTIPDLEIDGTTSDEYGLMVITINGKWADYQTDGAYWSLLCNGEPCNYGVSKQPIKDKEHYTFQYTPVKK